ncbi:hypothetical protein WOLCODRAFT_166625 [Wolfiporia cocos MD-104 SS10]|uniref:F-box domain-containing protein n=1 Tax=Wolfiporia cocos (strain MD-104) TaxID=742152 RepID=A0A2H3J1H1_WOLCO|nr:hypothetical protein WOLCODRAFT_166625 [Wolfiporia cocos MD-104 SS10]
MLDDPRIGGLHDTASLDDIHGFRGLRQLKIVGHLPRITSFLPNIETPSLQSLSLEDTAPYVTSDGEENPRRWRQVTSVICSLFGRTVRNISLKSRFAMPHDWSVEETVTGLITPLLGLRDLERFRCLFIIESVKMFITDSDIRLMAVSWPKIQELSLHQLYRPDLSPTIQCLIDVARLSPHLRTFILSGVTVGTLVPLESVPDLSHELEQLDLGYGTNYGYRFAEDLGQIIYRLFPNLDTTWNPRKNDGGWQRVLESVSKCQHN